MAKLVIYLCSCFVEVRVSRDLQFHFLLRSADQTKVSIKISKETYSQFLLGLIRFVVQDKNTPPRL